MMSRKVWSVAPRSDDSKAKSSTGCAEALPDGYGPCGEAAQDAAHFLPRALASCGPGAP